jgi:hypothetical protein
MKILLYHSAEKACFTAYRKTFTLSVLFILLLRKALGNNENKDPGKRLCTLQFNTEAYPEIVGERITGKFRIFSSLSY